MFKDGKSDDDEDRYENERVKTVTAATSSKINKKRKRGQTNDLQGKREQDESSVEDDSYDDDDGDGEEDDDGNDGSNEIGIIYERKVQEIEPIALDVVYESLDGRAWNRNLGMPEYDQVFQGF